MGIQRPNPWWWWRSGQRSGGIPTAAGTTPTEYKASITAVDKTSADSAVAEIIGVVSDSATAVARYKVAAEVLRTDDRALAKARLGRPGVRGPGGGGFGQRVGPMRSQLISKNKGTQEAERAVLAALRWLKEHQNRRLLGQEIPEALRVGNVVFFSGTAKRPDSEEFGRPCPRR